jgi:hypothetical protein
MGKLIERLRDASRSGVYRAGGDAEVLDALREGRLAATAFRLEGVGTKAELLRRLAYGLRLPDWFGHNWDALQDCLRERSGYLLFRGYDAIPAQDLDVLLDVLRASAEFHAEQGEPFFAVFVDPGGRLPLPDLFREA